MVIEHFNKGPNADPLNMIIQVTTGTGKSYLIHYISQEFSMVNFKRLLTNIRNAKPIADDWNLLMSQIDATMDSIEINTFNSEIHLFPMNTLVNVHNICMLKSLRIHISRCIVEHTKNKYFNDVDDEQLQREFILCLGERVMLTCNLWVEVGLVNGALGTVQNIFFSDGYKPPELPMYSTVSFDDYIGLPWDIRYSKIVPIAPVFR